MNSFTIDVEKGRVEVCGEVDPSTVVKELSTLGKVPELTSFEKNKPPQHVKINYEKKNIKDDVGSSDSDSDEDDDDHSKHVKGRSHSHVNIGPRRPDVIIPPMHHQQRPHHYNMNARGNGYFPAGPPWPEYQNMRMPYAGNGYRDRHYTQPPMYQRPSPPRPLPPGYGYHHQPTVPPRNEYYKFHGYNYMFEEVPVGNSSWQFFSDYNHETYCTIM